MTTVDPRAAEVIQFWRDAGAEAWFRKDEEFDSIFHGRFLDLHFAAARRELDDWLETPAGTLALMILLDQFPRNCFRGTGHMFATDPLALCFARLALAAGHAAHVDEDMRIFLLLPFEHSEDLADQDICVAETRSMDPELHKYAVVHHDVIARFGRFPHRNRVLGRETTAEEQVFLDEGGFSG